MEPMATLATATGLAATGIIVFMWGVSRLTAEVDAIMVVLS
jgi:hypothetical protein